MENTDNGLNQKDLYQRMLQWQFIAVVVVAVAADCRIGRRRPIFWRCAS